MTSNKNFKTTKQMSARERKVLQEKLNLALEKAIEDVSKFTNLYDIEPSVRITNNKSRLGSAKVTNGARLDAYAKRKLKIEKWDKQPTFKISVSARECADDADLNNTLYHEVIHCAPGCFNHGNRFKELASKVNTEYGVNVETCKKEDIGDEGNNRFTGKIDAFLPPLDGNGGIDARSLIASRIGESFSRGKKTYTFTGFNGNPKNCCDLVDGNGEQYKCSMDACASFLGLN